MWERYQNRGTMIDQVAILDLSILGARVVHWQNHQNWMAETCNTMRPNNVANRERRGITNRGKSGVILVSKAQCRRGVHDIVHDIVHNNVSDIVYNSVSI